MPIFHLHLDECGNVSRDETGTEYPDVDSATEAATKAAREVMCAEIAG